MSEPEPSRPTPEQNSAIHVLARRVGWTEREYRDVLHARYDVWTSTALKPALADDLISYMQGLLPTQEP